jgi:type II secretory pathway pseudopilin PulG
MKNSRTVILLGVIAALIAVIALQSKRHKQEMQRFRQSVRSITVVAHAKDAATGDILQCRVLSTNSGEDLEHSSWSASDNGLNSQWITTMPKTIKVTSPGYSTQSFVIATSWTNITAHLDKLEE